MPEFVLENNFTISLQIPKATAGICLITGKNGSGKTTLLRLLSKKYSLNQSENRLMEFHNKTNLFFEATTLMLNDTFSNNIRYLNSYLKIDYDNQKELIEGFSLNGLSKRKLKNFSTGELKKLLTVFNLCQNQNSIYFLDEPFENLDANSKQFLLEYLKSHFYKKKDLSLFITAHETKYLDGLVNQQVQL